MVWTLAPLKARLRSRSATALARGTEATVLMIQAAAPKQTGALANSVKMADMRSGVDRFSVGIVAEAKHADFVYNGTGFYGPRGSPIVPVSGVYLVFDYNGETQHVTSVSGQRPNKAWWDENVNNRWKGNVAAALAGLRG